MSLIIDRQVCNEIICTCHDDSAWTLKRNGAPKTYPKGCSSCGCRWRHRAPLQNASRVAMVEAVLAGNTPVTFSKLLPMDAHSRQERLEKVCGDSHGARCYTGRQDDYSVMPLKVKTFKSMTSKERDKYLGGQLARWSSHEGLQDHEREVKDYSPYGMVEEGVPA